MVALPPGHPDLNGPVDDLVAVMDMIEDTVQVDGVPYRFLSLRVRSGAQGHLRSGAVDPALPPP